MSLSVPGQNNGIWLALSTIFLSLSLSLTSSLSFRHSRQLFLCLFTRVVPDKTRGSDTRWRALYSYARVYIFYTKRICTMCFALQKVSFKRWVSCETDTPYASTPHNHRRYTDSPRCPKRDSSVRIHVSNFGYSLRWRAQTEQLSLLLSGFSTNNRD